MTAPGSDMYRKISRACLSLAGFFYWLSAAASIRTVVPLWLQRHFPDCAQKDLRKASCSGVFTFRSSKGLPIRRKLSQSVSHKGTVVLVQFKVGPSLGKATDYVYLNRRGFYFFAR